MSLKKQIEDNLNEALKAKDKKTYPTLRLIVSAIKDVEIAGRSKGQKDIKDSDIESLTKIEGIEEETAKELIDRAKEFYLKDQEDFILKLKNA